MNVDAGEVILDLIRKQVPRPESALGEDEFGGAKDELERPSSGTWTLVVLSDLKSTGRVLKIGVLWRMLEAALPFGSDMAISINGELITSSKIDTPIMAEWTIGPELGVNTIEIDEDESLSGNASGSDQAKPQVKEISISFGTSPIPFIELPEVGRVTGRVRLFAERISSGKSEERGASNGFHVNVLGRVINQTDPSFGEKNLNHAVWAQFRMTVRADGLNEFLTINREQFNERPALKIFRASLRKVFNIARNLYDSDKNAALPDGGMSSSARWVFFR